MKELKFGSITDVEAKDIAALTELLNPIDNIGTSEVLKELTSHFIRVLTGGESYSNFAIKLNRNIERQVRKAVIFHSGKLNRKEDTDYCHDVYGIYQPDYCKLGKGFTYRTKAGKKFLIDKIQPHIKKKIKKIELVYGWETRDFVIGMNIWTTDGRIYVIGDGDDTISMNKESDEIVVAKKKYVCHKGKIYMFFTKI